MPRKPAQIKASARAHWTSEPVADRAMPRLLTLKAGAEYLGVTPWALRERVWAGQVPVVVWPGGRKWYFDVRDLDRLINEHKRVID